MNLSPLLSAGFAGAFVDREVESKGLDFVDREKAKYEGENKFHDHIKTIVLTIYIISARKQAENAYDSNN